MRSSLIGIGINFLLALLKCLTGWSDIPSRSWLMALNLSPMSSASSVVYLGLRFAIKPPDQRPPLRAWQGGADCRLSCGCRSPHGRHRHRHRERDPDSYAPQAAKHIHALGPALGDGRQSSAFKICLEGEPKSGQRRAPGRCLASIQRFHHFGVCLRGNLGRVVRRTIPRPMIGRRCARRR